MKQNNSYNKNKIDIDTCLISKIKNFENEESQTIIYCNYFAPEKYDDGGWVNINTTTFLINEKTGNKLKLIHVENVPVAPQRHHFSKTGEKIRFTLIFQGIPKSWERFSLSETALFGDGFVVKNILKNSTGIYEINIY